MSLWSNIASTGTPPPRWRPASRLGRVLRFCLDQMSGMRISFGSGGHEQKLTLTFSFLSSLVASIVFVTTLWACGAGWFAGADRYTWFWNELSFFPDSVFVFLVRVFVASALTLGAWFFQVVAALGSALLVFLAAASVGAIVGFLFGVPRPLSESGPGAASAAAAAGGTAPSAQSGPATATAVAVPTPPSAPIAKGEPGWYANTNLTQVSDWLTKIIVGVGLVEAGRVSDAAGHIVDYVKPTLFDGHFGAGLIVPSLMIVGLIIGFMYCYLFTQLFLAALMVQTADAISQGIDLFKAHPLAFAELYRISAAAPVVAPAIRRPGSAAPTRPVQDATPEQTIAATQMLSVPLAEVEDPASLAIWARAGAVLDQYVRAAAGYTKLLTKTRTPEILAEAARVFASAHDFANARRLIDEAFARRTSAVDPATRERIAFDAAHLALYDPPPDGYRRALDVLNQGDVLLLDEGGGVHVLHACALGQQFAHETTLPPTEKDRIRRQALDDLRIGLGDPGNRPWVLYLLGRKPDGSPRWINPGPAEDDDLFPFKDDRDFLTLVGL